MIWKLLRQHISILQLVGFFFANLLGMLIVLLSLQFYEDISPAFNGEDSFIHDDYLIVSKRMSTMGGLTGSQTNSFSAQEIKDISTQSFARSAAPFTASQYKVSCYMGIDGVANFGTDMFFECVPDEYVDTDRSKWSWKEGDPEIPIILPRSYLAIYNFGFAQSQRLPKMTESIVSQIQMTLIIKGNGHEDSMRGRIIGFSNRLNTILVPESFLKWSNTVYAPDADTAPTRVILEVKNPTDNAISTYMSKHGYEIDDDKLQASKTTYFLKIVSGVVMSVGLLISILSFYILMLSVYLLVQKNTTKLQNLILIGYSPDRVSRPYQLLTIGINAGVLILAFIVLFTVRSYYLRMLWAMFPEMGDSSILPAVVLGFLLFAFVSIYNFIAIRRKITSIVHSS